MSKFLGDRLPEAVLQALGGSDLDAEFGHAYLLITADDDGSPRPSMLSVGELLACDGRTIRVQLWKGTQTGRNLASGRNALLCFVRKGAVLYIRGTGRELRGADAFDAFELDVRSVESDEHPGMPVTHGLEFTCSPEKLTLVLDSWRESLKALANLPRP